MQVYSKCSNYATDTCPCVLAENGKCIVCSMCRGEDFCTCSDTVSFCIMQELMNRGGKARQPYESLACEVMYVREYDDDIRFIRIKVPHVDDYQEMGAYVFVRVDENPFFDGYHSFDHTDRGDKNGETQVFEKGRSDFCAWSFP